MPEMEIQVSKRGGKYSLVLFQDGEVMEEYHLSPDLARSLRSALESVLSGRRPVVLATAKLKGYRLPPIEIEAFGFLPKE
jgi:hypothetical protein